jgi:hypothetical protein
MARLDDEPVSVKLAVWHRARPGPCKPQLDNPKWLSKEKMKIGKFQKKK